MLVPFDSTWATQTTDDLPLPFLTDYPSYSNRTLEAHALSATWSPSPISNNILLSCLGGVNGLLIDTHTVSHTKQDGGKFSCWIRVNGVLQAHTE